MQSLSELESRAPKKVPSLVELARKMCMKHSNREYDNDRERAMEGPERVFCGLRCLCPKPPWPLFALPLTTEISDVGNAPFQLVEPVLRKFKSRQMIQIEEQSPQIASSSEPVWQHMIFRDFPDRPWPKKHFRDTYLRYQEEKDERLRESSNRLKRNIEREQQRKSEIMITQLDVDPRAQSSQRKHYMQRNKASVVGRLRLEMRGKGSMFSPKNPTFAPNNNRPGFFASVSSGGMSSGGASSGSSGSASPTGGSGAPKSSLTRVSGGFQSDHRIPSIPIPIDSQMNPSRPLKRPTPMPSGAVPPMKMSRTDFPSSRRPETSVVTSRTPPQSPPPVPARNLHSRHSSQSPPPTHPATTQPTQPTQSPPPPPYGAGSPRKRPKSSSIFITRKR